MEYEGKNNMNIIQEMKDGMYTAFIDSNCTSNLAYKPQFLSNNYKEGRKVLSSLEDELLSCEEFCISVAFVTMSGVTPLLQTLKELERKNIRGRILTTDYLMFSQPNALDKLAEYNNIELKMYRCNEGHGGFHTKGYMFKEQEIYRIIVGSSNLTSDALTKNREWNTRLISTEDGEYAKEIIKEYEELWDSESSIVYSDFIEEYRQEYNVKKESQRLSNEIIRKQKEIAKLEQTPSVEQYRLKPNKMQVEFIKNLQKLRNEGAKRALLISATGERDIFMTSERNLEFTRVSAA